MAATYELELTLGGTISRSFSTCYTGEVKSLQTVPKCGICKTTMRGVYGHLCRPCLDAHKKGLSGMTMLRETDMNDDEIRESIRKYRIEWGGDPTSIQVANIHTLTMLYRGFDVMRNYTRNRLYGIKVIHNKEVPSTKVWII